MDFDDVGLTQAKQSMAYDTREKHPQTAEYLDLKSPSNHIFCVMQGPEVCEMKTAILKKAREQYQLS